MSGPRRCSTYKNQSYTEQTSLQVKNRPKVIPMSPNLCVDVVDLLRDLSQWSRLYRLNDLVPFQAPLPRYL